MTIRTPFTILALFLLSASVQAQQGLHTVRGKVWRDYNVDGLRGIEEANLGVVGMTVELWNSSATTMISSTQTDANGNYELSAFVSGTISYRVRIIRNTTRFPNISPKHVGGNMLVDSDFNPSGTFINFTDVINGLANVPRTAVDAGLEPIKILLGDRTWLDLDEDGRQEAGEPGLSGITVEIWNAQRTRRYDVDTSDLDGKYILLAPGYGSFRLRFSLPSGGNYTFMDSDPQDTNDSDVIPSGNDAGWTEIQVFSTNLISTSSIDAGYTFENPADVALEYTNVPSLVYPDSVVGWTLWVRERVQRAVGSVRLRATVPAGMTQFAWQCTPQGGATCPTGGSGALDITQNLPANGALRIDFSARAGMQAQFVTSASAEVASPQIEVSPANNVAQAIMKNDQIFRGSFDPSG